MSWRLLPRCTVRLITLGDLVAAARPSLFRLDVVLFLACKGTVQLGPGMSDVKRDGPSLVEPDISPYIEHQQRRVNKHSLRHI